MSKASDKYLHLLPWQNPHLPLYRLLLPLPVARRHQPPSGIFAIWKSWTGWKRQGLKNDLWEFSVPSNIKQNIKLVPSSSAANWMFPPRLAE